MVELIVWEVVAVEVIEFNPELEVVKIPDLLEVPEFVGLGVWEFIDEDEPNAVELPEFVDIEDLEEVPEFVGLGVWEFVEEDEPNAVELPEFVDIEDLEEVPEFVGLEVWEFVEEDEPNAVELPEFVDIEDLEEVPEFVGLEVWEILDELVELPEFVDEDEVLELPELVDVNELVEVPDFIGSGDWEFVDIEESEEVPEIIDVDEDELLEVPELVDVDEDELSPEFVKLGVWEFDPEFVGLGVWEFKVDSVEEGVWEFVDIEVSEEVPEVVESGLCEAELEGQSLFVIEIEGMIVLLPENVCNLEGVAVLHSVADKLYCWVLVPMLEVVPNTVLLLVSLAEEEIDRNALEDFVSPEDLDGVDEEESEGEFPFVDILDTDELPVTEFEVEAEKDSIEAEVDGLEDGLPESDNVCWEWVSNADKEFRGVLVENILKDIVEVRTYVSEVIGDRVLEEDELLIADKERIEVLDSIADFVPLEEIVEVLEVDIDRVGVLLLSGVLLDFIDLESEIEILGDLVSLIVIVPDGLPLIVFDCDVDFVIVGEDEELLEILADDVIVDDKE